MTPRQKRMSFVAMLIVGVGIFVYLITQALNENINHFYSPTDIAEGKAPEDHSFRIGGLVVDGSVKRAEDSLNIMFDLTDGSNNYTVSYNGILPDLFREGQGIVSTGKIQGGVFVADEVLAKHDENYMPPEVAEALKKSGKYEYAKDKEHPANIPVGQNATPSPAATGAE